MMLRCYAYNFRFIFEQRKNDIFWPAMEAFLDLILRRLELDTTQDLESGGVVAMLLKVVQEADTVQGLFALVVTKIEGLLLTSCRFSCFCS